MTLYAIGELARRTGLSVKTIRFYSDCGLVPESGRSPAGYRRYDVTAVARLDLVRTLRDLGMDLTTVRRVLDREITLSDVAAAHVEALDAQIRLLRLRRAVLSTVAKRGSTAEEMDLMHKLAKLSEEERRRIIDEFLDEVFADQAGGPFAGRMRATWPQLPDDPTPAQVDAWIELVELVRDPGFRARVRQMAQQAPTPSDRDNPTDWQQAAETVTAKAGAALAAGIDPASPAAAPIVAEIIRAFAAARDLPAAEARAWIINAIETGGDRRVERYWHLVGAVNGWPERPSVMPAWEWLLAALHASP